MGYTDWTFQSDGGDGIFSNRPMRSGLGDTGHSLQTQRLRCEGTEGCSTSATVRKRIPSSLLLSIPAHHQIVSTLPHLRSRLVLQNPSLFAVIWLWPKWVKNSFAVGEAVVSPTAPLCPRTTERETTREWRVRARELSHYLPSVPRLFLPSEALTS